MQNENGHEREYLTRVERRRRERDARRAHPLRGDPSMTMKYGDCRYPRLFDAEGSCICGHGSAMDCPCSPLDALVHLERSHSDKDSTLMRTALQCQLGDSEPVPTLPSGTAHQGSFEAPCGDTVMYMTTAQFPTMAHYRWHAVYDHLEGGDCQSIITCGDAVRSGDI